MLTRGPCLVAACLAALCLAGAARGAAPGGPYVYEIGGDSEIWYAHGDGHFCDDEDGGSICVDSITETDGTGAVTGSGTLAIHISDSNGQIDGDLAMVITGGLGGSTKAPKPKLAAAIEGDLTFNSDGSMLLVHLAGVSRFTCKNPLPHGPEFECPGHLKLCGLFAGHKSCFNGRFGMNVGADGGPWTLETELETDTGTNAITGTGTATLANAASQSYVASGKYTRGSGLSKLTLRALDPLSKNKASFSQTFGMYSPTSTTKIVFKVAGVTGTYVLSLAPTFSVP